MGRLRPWARAVAPGPLCEDCGPVWQRKKRRLKLIKVACPGTSLLRFSPVCFALCPTLSGLPLASLDRWEAEAPAHPHRWSSSVQQPRRPLRLGPATGCLLRKDPGNRRCSASVCWVREWPGLGCAEPPASDPSVMSVWLFSKEAGQSEA